MTETEDQADIVRTLALVNLAVVVVVSVAGARPRGEREGRSMRGNLAARRPLRTVLMKGRCETATRGLARKLLCARRGMMVALRRRRVGAASSGIGTGRRSTGVRGKEETWQGSRVCDGKAGT